MKYAAFAALCDREFQRDGGVVRALYLTGPSAAELAEDILTDRAVPIPPVRRRAAAAVTSAPNPVTQSRVTITAGAEADSASVAYGPDGQLTRTVAAD